MIVLNGVLLNPRFGGITTYTTELLHELEKLVTDNPLIIYCSKDQFEYYKDRFRFEVRSTPLLSDNPVQRILRETFFWNREIKNQNITLFHSPISYIPFRLSIPTILTLHDLRIFRFPQTYSRARRMFLKQAIRYSVQKATKIITVSQFTKKELEQLFEIPSEKIKVIYEGINLKRFEATPQDTDREILKKYGVCDRYILTVGHLEPRKNYLRLIKAFQQLNNMTDESFQLVIAGRELLEYQSLYRWVEDHSLNGKVIFSGFIQSEHLPIFYRNASVFVLASIYEGFGLTPLESLASGVPVAASNVSSIPEVLGTAALYFDPFEIDDIAEKMKILIKDSSVRQKILDDARGIFEHFTWPNCARETMLVYKEVLDEPVTSQ